MRVLVLGGYGLIGSEIVRQLLEAGHNVRALGRNVTAAAISEQRCEWVQADISSLLRPQDWSPFTREIDVVINASGALQSGQQDNLKTLQQDAIIALIDNCSSLDAPPSLVQISAPGADTNASTEFLRTKGEADHYLRSSTLQWLVLKPALVISPIAYGGTALLRGLAALPFVTPLVYANSVVTTVSVGDVASIVVAAVEGKVQFFNDIDLAELEPKTLGEVVGAFRRWLGKRDDTPIIRLPDFIATAAGKLADALGLLGWRSPLRSTSMKVMAKGVVGNGSNYVAAMGRPCKSLEDTLRGIPPTVQEQWFASLFLLLPLSIATLSVFWFGSGVIGLIALEDSVRPLLTAGLGERVATLLVLSGAVLDITLGLMAVYRPTARTALYGMIATTFAYLTMGSLMLPSLWLDPLGPYVKTIPCAVLALLTAATLKAR